MWASHFPDAVNKLCSKCSNDEHQPETGRILAQVIGDFLRELGAERVSSSKFFTHLEMLFESEFFEERRAGLLLLNKLMDPSKGNELDLFARITIMECLDVEETSGGAQLSLWKEKSKAGNWMRLLYIRLLQHNNMPMLRISIEFIMDHFTAAELSAANLLTEFLAATNHLELHNFEVYALPEQKMLQLASHVDDDQFLTSFSEVAWLGVPLLRWLDCLQFKTQPQISKELLLKLCANVWALKNTLLRNNASERICEVFKVTIENLSLANYMIFIRALYHEDGIVSSYALFLLETIIDNCPNISEEIVNFSKSNYEMLSNPQDNNYLWQPLLGLVRQLENMLKAWHGWWRLPAYFVLHNFDEAQYFYRVAYDINIELIVDYKDLQEYLIHKLDCQTDEDKFFVRQQSVDLFLKKHVRDWSQLEEFHLEPVQILENGTFNTLQQLADLLGRHNKALPDGKIVEALLMQLKKYSRRLLISGQILGYVSKYMDVTTKKTLCEEMIANSNCGWELSGILNAGQSPLRSTLLKGLLGGETPTGVDRIEAACLNSRSTWNIIDHIKRNNYITYVANMKDELNKYEIYNELLTLNEEIAKKDIAVNSKDHRLQMRIARTLYSKYNHNGFWSDRLWTALFAPRNLLNIRYLYEYLVATQLPSFELLIEKLKTLSSLQADERASVVSVVHIYCVLNWDSVQLERLEEALKLISEQITPIDLHTKETDMFQKLVLRRLLDKSKKSSMKLPLNSALKSILECVHEDTVSDNQMKARLLLPDELKYFHIAETILYLTNAPFDEYDNPKWEHSGNEMDQLHSILTPKVLLFKSH